MPRAGSPRIYGSVFERQRMFSPYRPGRKSPSKLLGRDTDHSSAYTAEAKKVCSYKSNFPCAFASCTERTLHLYLYKQNITHILHAKISNISVFWQLNIQKANCKLHYMLCYIVLRCVVLCCVVLCCVVLCCVVSCRVMCRVVSCRVVSCRVASCHVMSCYNLDVINFSDLHLHYFFMW